MIEVQCTREFHILGALRKKLGVQKEIFASKGPVLFANLRAARDFTKKYTEYKENQSGKSGNIRPEDFYAMGLIDEILHYVISTYHTEHGTTILEQVYKDVENRIGETDTKVVLREFCRDFPPTPVFTGKIALDTYLDSKHEGELGWFIALEELMMLWVENMNPAYHIARDLIDHSKLLNETPYEKVIVCLREIFGSLPPFGPDIQSLIEMLRAPAVAHPDSLQKQLEFIRDRWGYLLGDKFLRLLRGIDFLNEVNQFSMNIGKVWGKPETNVFDYTGLEEYERFSPDRDWMPKVVVIAKSTLVWLYQLSKDYQREIKTLDDIPDEEIDRLARYGFNGLWLIGLWERSGASKRIKNLCGNPDAASSAYSLFDYDIADDLGGWEALGRLREKCEHRGIRLASDMVPNHTGMDSKWIHEHPEYFIQLDHSPFPGYTFNGENLSTHPEIGIYLEDHYYNQSDASVVFKRVDFRNGDTKYLYHGNDGTHMPWNDTAQLDFLNPETREAVIQIILHVAKNFPIIRFDAAMTLAKKHIQRLWYPEAGRAGDIPSRAEHGLSNSEFNARIPQEFWRELVDRAAKEAPDTLLLAEAFWMMEGYFVRTLGMHRVYNSAFMNMLKNEDNDKYRQTIKNTLEFDKDILKRFVNFMNNPDEETAVAQFGKGDKYFGVCTLMATMPGLPMFGHGQIEGYHEKYGMEYQRAYFNESPDLDLVARHEKEIFPILKKRYLFAEVQNFYLYDFWAEGGWVNENVFAYTNSTDLERALVVYNNAYEGTRGFIKDSVGYVEKLPSGEKDFRRTTLAQALKLRSDDTCYVLMWEQRSNLWYIRRSIDLADRGLFVDVPGYSCHIFMDIHEVEDNKFSHYRILHDQLQGRGVRNITQAIRDIILEPVYREFRNFFTPEYLEQFRELLGITSGKAPKLVEWFVDKMRMFLKPLSQFLSSDLVVGETVERFVQGLNNILSLRAVLELPEMSDERMYLLDKTYSMDKTGIILSAFLILHALGDQEEEWYLEGKIEDITGQAVKLNSLFKWMESYRSWSTEEAKVSDLAGALETYSVVEFLGANYYNGTMWYRKENLENFAWWASLYHVLSAPKVNKALIQKAYQRSQAWIGFMEPSEFKLETLSELVQKPTSKVKKTTGKANSEKRNTSTKTKSGKAVAESGKTQEKSPVQKPSQKKVGKIQGTIEKKASEKKPQAKKIGEKKGKKAE